MIFYININNQNLKFENMTGWAIFSTIGNMPITRETMACIIRNIASIRDNIFSTRDFMFSTFVLFLVLVTQ